MVDAYRNEEKQEVNAVKAHVAKLSTPVSAKSVPEIEQSRSMVQEADVGKIVAQMHEIFQGELPPAQLEKMKHSLTAVLKSASNEPSEISESRRIENNNSRNRSINDEQSKLFLNQLK